MLHASDSLSDRNESQVQVAKSKCVPFAGICIHVHLLFTISKEKDTGMDHQYDLLCPVMMTQNGSISVRPGIQSVPALWFAPDWFYGLHLVNAMQHDAATRYMSFGWTVSRFPFKFNP